MWSSCQWVPSGPWGNHSMTTQARSYPLSVSPEARSSGAWVGGVWSSGWSRRSHLNSVSFTGSFTTTLRVCPSSPRHSARPVAAPPCCQSVRNQMTSPNWSSQAARTSGSRPWPRVAGAVEGTPLGGSTSLLIEGEPTTRINPWATIGCSPPIRGFPAREPPESALLA